MLTYVRHSQLDWERPGPSYVKFTVNKQHDLTPGIPADEYDSRRRKLMERLPDNSLVVAVAAPVKYMSASA